jgi:ABC-type branched-subunit amino acid transport system ATPase component/ABC-type branched-subunit amino acid transport system permease subunit
MSGVKGWLGLRTGDEWAFVAVIVFLIALPYVNGQQFGTLNRIANIAIFGVAVLGMNLVLGIGGQYWLGQSALFAIGAYGAGVLMTRYAWSFWAAAPLIALVTGVVGAVLGIPGLRLGGFYLALSTFFFASIIVEIIYALPHWTGGSSGLVGVPSPSIGGQPFTILQVYWLTLGVLLVVFLMNFSLLRTQWGRVLLLTGHDENQARSVGIRLWKVKMLIYAVGAIPVGLAGAMYASVNNVVIPGEVDINLTITFLAAVVIGGSGTLAGPIIGVALLNWLPNLLTGLQTYTLIGYGVVLFLVMIFAPQGLLPTGRRLLRGAAAWVRTQRHPGAEPAPPPVATEEESAGAMQTTSAAEVESVVEEAVEPEESKAPMLAVRSVSKRFGGLAALSEVNVEVERGTLCAIIGPNGSGKTTLLNIVTGFYSPNGGSISIGGRDVGRLGPHRIASNLGVRRSFQTAAVVPMLTVLENVELGLGMPRNTIAASTVAAPTVWRREREIRLRAHEMLSFVGLAGLEHAPAGSLAAGQRRLLEIARSLIRLPNLLLLDEPSSGLNPSETVALGELLHEVIALDVAVVVVEHNMNFVLRYASSVVVLDQGLVVASGTPAEIAGDPEVKRAYLGSQVK